MKTLYIDCRTGASGDMLAGALLGLVDDPGKTIGRINSVGLEGVAVTLSKTRRCGIEGNSFCVRVRGEHEEAGCSGSHCHHHGHSHRSLEDMFAIVDSLSVSRCVREKVKAVYSRIAEAESKAHGEALGEVHFHEVGALDAVMDITAVMVILEEIAPGRIISSVPETGGGFVRCAHGMLPVPAPATLNLLSGIPFTSGAADCELLTPTGAALLGCVVDEFVSSVAMTPEKTAIGCGTRELPERPNILRVVLGEDVSGRSGAPNGEVSELKCNIDDMTGEDIAHACRLILSKGALDVSSVPIVMKKGRPGVMIVVLCAKNRADEFAALILELTSTFGVRRTDMSRYELDRVIETLPDGTRVKKGSGYGVTKRKLEFEDRIAGRNEEWGVTANVSKIPPPRSP